jgi:hypothetical protein
MVGRNVPNITPHGGKMGVNKKKFTLKTYCLNTIIGMDGSVHLFDLPPHQEVESVVLDPASLSEEMQNWLSDLRNRHPFAKMSKEEILMALRNTRTTVSDDRHES